MKLKRWARCFADTARVSTLIIILGGASCRKERAIEAPPLSIRRQTQATAAQTPVKAEIFSAQVSSQLRQNLDQSLSKDLPGAVLYVATSDGTWMDEAGWADIEKQKLMQPTDRFRIASLTKMFVAVVCLQLAEDGQLDLSDAIVDWLPQEVGSRISDSREITIRQLLNHTSGLPDPYSDAFKQAVMANPTHKWQAKEVLEYAEGRGAATSRGSFFYSNTNYLLLELIVEKATGNSLSTEIRQRIIEPLELNDTFMEAHEPIPGGFVQGYQDWNADGTPENVTQPLLNDGLGLGDGGLVSSAPDLARFMRSLFSNGVLLRSETLEKMMTLVRSDKRGGYGLGITYTPTIWGEAWGHTGKTTGFVSDILYLPAHDLIIVAWTNSGDSRQTNPSDLIQESLRIILDVEGR
ncbi:MAG: beta-lactamase family protein [Timaviella obliquedivisa GSE-PSE-MK23-08B]|jgi:D-alanyl-D-alanine carboxypeptidase|nr:beta-lactamase family protein [Timaviella obliquedivisa GSE-PSE-MK23-08B]